MDDPKYIVDSWYSYNCSDPRVPDWIHYLFSDLSNSRAFLESKIIKLKTAFTIVSAEMIFFLKVFFYRGTPRIK